MRVSNVRTKHWNLWVFAHAIIVEKMTNKQRREYRRQQIGIRDTHLTGHHSGIITVVDV